MSAALAAPGAFGQVSFDPQIECVEEVMGACVEGCDECAGTQCTVGSVTVTVTVEEGLKADGASAKCDTTSATDILRARARVIVTGILFPVLPPTRYMICEAITSCGDENAQACGRCTEITSSTNFNILLSEMNCDENAFQAGKFQYHVWVFPLDGSACSDGCDDAPCGHPGNTSCSLCSSTPAYAASCCVELT